MRTVLFNRAFVQTPAVAEGCTAALLLFSKRVDLQQAREAGRLSEM
jgi:hypothetical protein